MMMTMTVDMAPPTPDDGELADDDGSWSDSSDDDDSRGLERLLEPSAQERGASEETQWEL